MLCLQKNCRTCVLPGRVKNAAGMRALKNPEVEEIFQGLIFNYVHGRSCGMICRPARLSFVFGTFRLTFYMRRVNPVNAFTQFLTHFKKRPFFRCDLNCRAGPGVIAGSPAVLTDLEAAESAYLNAVTVDQRVRHRGKNRIDCNLRYFRRYAGIFRQFLYEL
jgi:hypothetical protein